MFSVILKTEKLPAPTIISKILSEFCGISSYDASQKAAKTGGFLAENLDEKEADKLTDICFKNGVEAIKISNKNMPKIPQPAILNSIAFKDTSLEFLINENLISKKFEDIIILAYFPFKITTSKEITEKQRPSMIEKAVRLGIMMTTGIPVGLGKGKEIKKEIKESEITFYLDIIFNDNLHIKITSRHFDFSCLKEEKTYSSEMNFKILTKKIAKLCPRSLKNSALYELMENKPPIFKYESISEIEKEILRLLIIKSY